MNKYNTISISPFSSSTEKEHYLLSCNGRYFEVNQPLAELLTDLQQNETQEAAIQTYINKKEGKYTFEQTESLIKKHIDPLLTIPKEKECTFLYEKELLTAATVERFSKRFSFLFNRKFMWSLLSIATIMDIFFFINVPDLLVFNNRANAFGMAGLLIFMLVSSFFHELGHASACKYCGVKHGSIGLGLYLNFPVLYTDVTEIWKLNRKQRFMVNIAGVYFQCFFLIVLLVGFWMTGDDMLRYMILILNLGFLMTLNPFFKFDGYWIVSDLLGVPSLRKRSIEIIKYYWYRIMRRRIQQMPYLLRIGLAERWGLAIYAVIVNFFMGYYFIYIIPRFLYNFLLSFPREMQELILYLSNNLTPPFALMRNIGIQLLFLALLGYLFTKMIRSLKKQNSKNGEQA